MEPLIDACFGGCGATVREAVLAEQQQQEEEEQEADPGPACSSSFPRTCTVVLGGGPTSGPMGWNQEVVSFIWVFVARAQADVHRRR